MNANPGTTPTIPAARPRPPGFASIWRWAAASLLAMVAVLALRSWNPRGPSPPVVNTNGFDPAIAGAINTARQEILKSPRSAEARGRLGMVLLAHEIRPEAAQCFRQAAALAPREPRWPYYLGLAQLVDRPLEALTNLADAVRLFPKDEPAPRLRLADALLSQGRLEEAEPFYRQFWPNDTNSPLAAIGLARIAHARDRPLEAIAFLTEAVRQHRSTRQAACRLLLALHQQLGRTNEANQLAIVQAGLPLDQPMPDPFFTEVQKLQTGEKAWTDRAEEWIKTGQAQEASRLLEKTVEMYPQSDRALFLLGRARLRLGDLAGAEAILTRAVALAPGSVEAQIQLGVVRLTRGRPRDAQPCFRAAIQAKPNLGEAWYNLGLSLGAERQFTESTAAFREAIRLKPNLVEAYLGLAVTLRTAGQPQEAAQELRRALALQPSPSLRQKLLDQLKLIPPP